ncbi:hypothetical protein ACTA71_007645 [Dictyostelium dimigraforme]
MIIQLYQDLNFINDTSNNSNSNKPTETTVSTIVSTETTVTTTIETAATIAPTKTATITTGTIVSTTETAVTTLQFQQLQLQIVIVDLPIRDFYSYSDPLSIAVKITQLYVFIITNIGIIICSVVSNNNGGWHNHSPSTSDRLYDYYYDDMIMSGTYFKRSQIYASIREILYHYQLFYSTDETFLLSLTYTILKDIVKQVADGIDLGLNFAKKEYSKCGIIKTPLQYPPTTNIRGSSSCNTPIIACNKAQLLSEYEGLSTLDSEKNEREIDRFSDNNTSDLKSSFDTRRLQPSFFI